MKHRWGEKTVVSLQKTERECLNGCGTVRVTRHETEGGRDKHWVEFWRDLERIDRDDKTPRCIGRPTGEAVYNARDYPL